MNFKGYAAFFIYTLFDGTSIISRQWVRMSTTITSSCLYFWRYDMMERTSAIGHDIRRMNMATAQKVSYFAMQIPNRAGEAGRILTGLAKSGVNLLAFTGFPHGNRSQVDFIRSE